MSAAEVLQKRVSELCREYPVLAEEQAEGFTGPDANWLGMQLVLTRRIALLEATQELLLESLASQSPKWAQGVKEIRDALAQMKEEF